MPAVTADEYLTITFNFRFLFRYVGAVMIPTRIRWVGVCCGWLLSAAIAAGWGGRLHMDIGYAAARAVPDEMEGWRRYAPLLSRHSIGPDLWKGVDKSEGPRHYLEPENIGGGAVTGLPRRIDDFYDRIGRRSPERTGLAPWVILDLQDWLVNALAEGRMDEAIAIAAAQGHYVGDIHQPLHCTADFDGKNRSFTGVHIRWEMDMSKGRWNRRMLKSTRVDYIDDPWNSVLEWIEQAHLLAPRILQADETALLRSGGDKEATVYFDALWDETRDIYIDQANAAVIDLAGLWYTAWVDAGKPALPPPPEFITDGSLHLAAHSPMPKKTAWSISRLLIIAITAVGVWILIRSLWPRRKKGAAP